MLTKILLVFITAFCLGYGVSYIHDRRTIRDGNNKLVEARLANSLLTASNEQLQTASETLMDNADNLMKKADELMVVNGKLMVVNEKLRIECSTLIGR